MKMKILLFLMIVLSVVACKSAAQTKNDYCKYARSKPLYDFIYLGEEITGCEVLKAESKEGDLLGQKFIGHSVKLKLKIERVSDDCDSKQGLNCNLLGRDCIMENGKKANFCKYPDAVVREKKGAVREVMRSLELVQNKGESAMSVFKNVEVKK